MPSRPYRVAVGSKKERRFETTQAAFGALVEMMRDVPPGTHGIIDKWNWKENRFTKMIATADRKTAFQLVIVYRDKGEDERG